MVKALIVLIMLAKCCAIILSELSGFAEFSRHVKAHVCCVENSNFSGQVLRPSK